MVYNGYYKVMSNIPKMGHLPTPVIIFISHGLSIVGVPSKYSRYDLWMVYFINPLALQQVDAEKKDVATQVALVNVHMFAAPPTKKITT